MARSRNSQEGRGLGRWVGAALVLAGLAVGGGVGGAVGYGVRWRGVAAPPAARVEEGASGGTWSVATYNTRNFFDGFVNPYRGEVGKHPKSVRDQEALAEALRTLDADVVVLEEVEWGGMLRQFVRERLSDCRYEYIVDEPTGDPRGLSVAMLSRFPVVRIVSHRLVPLDDGVPAHHFSRDLLRADVVVRGGYVVSVYGVHLKSKLDSADDPGSARWRLAEARKVREIMTEEVGREHLGAYLLLGDCNDGVDSEAVAAMRGSAGSAGYLVDALGKLSPAERITFINAQYREAIDQILLSGELAGRMATGSGEVVRGGVFEKASDHRPVRVVLRLPG